MTREISTLGSELGTVNEQRVDGRGEEDVSVAREYFFLEMGFDLKTCY